MRICLLVLLILIFVVLQNASAKMFGKKERIQNDWFDDQDEEIQHRHALRRVRELKNKELKKRKS